MTTQKPSEAEIRRILVALDAGPHSLAAMEAAANLAARMQAEVLGLFVEDINLLRLAALPFARELASLAGSERALDSASMEQSLRAQAERVRRQLATAAERTRVRWSFRVARGRVLTEVLAHAPGIDMLILGTSGRSVRPMTNLGSTTREVISQASCSVMVLRHGAAIDRPVVVVFDGSAVGHRALALAAQLAEQDHKNLVVLIPPTSDEQASALQRDGERMLEARNMTARYARLRDNTPHALVESVHREGGRTLVLDATSPVASAQALFDTLDCPLILVR